MYAAERQHEILRRAREDGRADVAHLADELDVAPETIRRDLTVLERHGLVHRVHGGALPVERLGFEPAVADRERVLVAEKERIAKRALDELPDGGSVIIDAGTTTGRLAQLLPADRELTVVTNAIPVATTLAENPAISLHLLGGRVRGTTLAAVDDWALAALAGVFVDVAFMGTNGLTALRGASTPDRGEAAVKAAMIAAARRTVVLADHTKIGADHFAAVAPLSAIDLIVTDTGLDAELAAELEAAGPEVVRA